MLLVGAGKLITRDPAQPFLENGCVAMDEKGLIAAVGDTDALKARYPGAEFLDAAGCVIMPGLINAHDHIYSAFARALYPEEQIEGHLLSRHYDGFMDKGHLRSRRG